VAGKINAPYGKIVVLSNPPQSVQPKTTTHNHILIRANAINVDGENLIAEEDSLVGDP